jgi:predicted metal-dependent peptidase
MKLTAEQRIERAHVTLMQSPNFCLFSGVFMVGKVTVCDKTKTAYTNSRDVTYGRKFVDSLTDKQLAFLVIHEAMHKAYRHMIVWKHLPNKQVANAAMDFVINLQIRDSDPNEKEVAMPRDADGELMGCIDEKYRGMDTKQVYDLLMEECDDGTDGPTDEDGDIYIERGSGGGKPSDGNGGNGELDEHDWEGASELTQEEKDELNREIDSALREGAILAGKMNGNVPRGIGELLHPKVDWKEALREFIKVSTRGGDQSTWRRPNRRYLANGIIMPSAESHKAKTIVVGVDASGSIWGHLLTQFLSETQTIADEVNPECIELLYWDTEVAKRETYREAEVAEIAKSTKPEGGGGTSPDCIPKYLVDEQIDAQCIIMLTDGEFYAHEASAWAGVTAPVLWCVIGKSNFVPVIGQSVYVE